MQTDLTVPPSFDPFYDSFDVLAAILTGDTVEPNRVAARPAGSLSAVFILGQGLFAFFDILPRSATQRVFPRQNDRRISDQIMLLPLNFQFHLRGRFAA